MWVFDVNPDGAVSNMQKVSEWGWRRQHYPENPYGQWGDRTGMARLFLDDVELEFGGGPGTQITSTASAQSSRRPALATVRLEAGHAYRVRVEFRQAGTGGLTQLAWIPPAAGAGLFVPVAGGTRDGAPIRSLRGFERVHLKGGQSRQVTFAVAASDLPAAAVEVSVGGGQPSAIVPYVTGTLTPPIGADPNPLR
jgi:hypothetical protein